MIRRALAPLALLLLLAVPTAAWAAPKVALTAIEGDSEGDVREAVADALDGDDLRLIGKREVNRAVDKIGDLSDLTEKRAKKLAKDLSADAIIAGSLDKDGANKVLRFKLFVNGKAKKGFSVKFKSANSKKFKDMLRKKMVEKIDAAAGGDAEEEEAPKKPKKGAKVELDDEDPNAGVKPRKGAKAEKSEEKAEKLVKKGGKAEKAEKAEKSEKSEEKPEKLGKKGGKAEKATKAEPEEEEEAPKRKPVGGDEEDEEEEEEEEPRKRTAALGADEEDEPGISKRVVVGAKSARGANRAAMRVDLGASMLKRTMEFNTTLPANVAPRPPQLKAVPGFRVEGELYPLMFMNPDSLASGLGVAFDYDRTASLKLGTSAEPGVLSPTQQFRYSVGVRFRYAGKRPSSPSVTAMFDIGRSRFKPDRSNLMDPASLDLPDTYYKYLAPGVAFRLPIGGRLAFYAGAATMLVSDAGEIVRPYSYGRASVLGIDATGGLDILITKSIGFRVSGDFIQYGFKFQGGGGMQANSRDGDPSDLDVFGAADRSIGGSATVSVLY